MINLTISQIARKLEPIVGRDRASMISRTEVIRITNEGNRQHYEEKGVKKVQWVSAPEIDKRLCPDCRQMNNKVFRVDDAKGLIPKHPGCRCSWVPYIEW